MSTQPPPPPPQTSPQNPNPPTPRPLTPNEAMMSAINGTLTQVKSLLEGQSAHNIPPYTGNPREFSSWLKRLEKNAILSGADDAQVKNLAYMTSDGPVSDWIRRRIMSPTHAQETWDTFKANLAQRFAEISDPQYAFTLLKRECQKPNEPVVMWAERLINLINTAFLNQNMNSELIDKQCIGFFVDGLTSHSLKFRLLRNNPDTLQKAIDLAVEEENLQRRFDLRIGRSASKRDYNAAFQTLGKNKYRHTEDVYPTRHTHQPPLYDLRDIEPMEIDHFRHKRPCPRCRMPHSKSSPCRTRQVDVVENTRPAPRSTPLLHCRQCNRQDHLTRDCPFTPAHSPPPCKNCFQKGHDERNCPFPPTYRPPICYNCKKEGHFKYQCRSPYRPSEARGCHWCSQPGHMAHQCPHIDHRSRMAGPTRRQNTSFPRPENQRLN